MLSQKLYTTFFLGALLSLSSAFPQTAPVSPTTPSPSATPIPWSTKLSTFRTYVLSQPTTNATAGFSNGPSLQLSFSDSSCLQIRFYNWDCFHAIPYKMAGVVKWLDSATPQEITDPYRYYVYGRYVDPDDGRDFYGVARLTFGTCGNRGPQSSCGVTWCIDSEGSSTGTGAVKVPEGQNPYVDPNSKNNLCPWLKENETTGSVGQIGGE